MAYACTSGSFVAGLAGERALVAAHDGRGRPGRRHHQRRTARGADRTSASPSWPWPRRTTPTVTARLHDFLDEAGVEVVAAARARADRPRSGPCPTPSPRDSSVTLTAPTPRPFHQLHEPADLRRRSRPLEAELGKPVLTANQVTMWVGAAPSSAGRPSAPASSCWRDDGGPDTSGVHRAAAARPRSMQQRSLGALVVCDPANLFYLTGYNAWSFYTPQCLLVPAEGELHLFARAQDAKGATLHVQPARGTDPWLPRGTGAPAGRAPVRLDRRRGPRAGARRRVGRRRG